MNGIYRMPDGVRALCAPLPEQAPRCDVAIVGGGTAGAVAAIAAAREGARVIVVERLNGLGGMSTAGRIEGYYYGSRGGVYEQLDAMTKAYEPLGYAPSGPNGFNAELKKRVLENELLGAGGSIVYDADLTGVLMDGHRVVGVEYAQDDGLHAVYAQTVIDASAEAYVCLLAGASYTLGRDMDHKVQPFGNVRIDYHPESNHSGHSYTDCGYANPIDPEDYSRAIMAAAGFAVYLKDDYRQPPRLLGITQAVGMREGPLVEGDARLTLQDAVDRRLSREKLLFTAYSNADNHGKDMAFENRPQKDWMIACSLWGLNFTVPVPMGAVIPKGIDGLLMAGRMISVDHDLASCIRMERDVQKCGEAVGILAAEAAKRALPVREVPYEPLAFKLRQSGCLLEQNDLGFIDSRRAPDMGRVFFPETIEEIERGLASDAPGMAMWRVRQLKDRAPIRTMLERHEETHLPIHAAMALALADDASGAQMLIDCVKRRDAFVPKSSRKYNMLRSASALYLLGRLHYKPALDELLSLIANWRSITIEAFVPDEFMANEEECRFQYLSQAIVAAMEIALAYPETRERVDAVVHGVIDAPDFSINSTLKMMIKSMKPIRYQMAPMIRNAVHFLTLKRSKTSNA